MSLIMALYGTSESEQQYHADHCLQCPTSSGINLTTLKSEDLTKLPFSHTGNTIHAGCLQAKPKPSPGQCLLC